MNVRKVEALLAVFFSEDEMHRLPYDQWNQEQLEAVYQTLELIIEKEAELITEEVEACEWLRDITVPEGMRDELLQKIRQIEEERN